MKKLRNSIFKLFETDRGPDTFKLEKDRIRLDTDELQQYSVVEELEKITELNSSENEDTF